MAHVRVKDCVEALKPPRPSHPEPRLQVPPRGFLRARLVWRPRGRKEVLLPRVGRKTAAHRSSVARLGRRLLLVQLRKQSVPQKGSFRNRPPKQPSESQKPAPATPSSGAHLGASVKPVVGSQSEPSVGHRVQLLHPSPSLRPDLLKKPKRGLNEVHQSTKAQSTPPQTNTADEASLVVQTQLQWDVLKRPVGGAPPQVRVQPRLPLLETLKRVTELLHPSRLGFYLHPPRAARNLSLTAHPVALNRHETTPVPGAGP